MWRNRVHIGLKQCWPDLGQLTLQQLTMAIPFYVKSIVKYKSPHPQDLSFLRGEIIRVIGYADRTMETTSPADLDEEEEDDRWYMGESLDGSKQGQFPASLVERTEYSVATQPSTQAEAAQPIATVSSQSPLVMDECVPEKESTDVQKTSEHPSDDAMFIQSAEIPVVMEEKSALPVEVANQEATQIVPTHEDAMAEGAPQSQPASFEATDIQVQSCDHDSKPRDTLTSVNEPTVVETNNQQESKTENEDTLPEPINTVKSQPTATDEKISVPSEIDPSRMSLRDRIAAFNKTANKTPPPIPKGKPGTWKRPPVSDNAEKPLMPSQVPPALATSTAPRVHKAPDTSHSDASTDVGSSFSASDAKSSIKMSLKERMAALQRGQEGGVAIPAPSSERAVPVVTKHEEEAQDKTDEVTDDEATRRAAIAKRMAALGGRRVDAGLFASASTTNSEPAAVTEKYSEQNDVEAVKEKMEPCTESGSPTDAPQPLAVPKRTAAPRKRRTKPVKPASPVAEEPEKPFKDDNDPETDVLDSVSPPQQSELETPNEQDIPSDQANQDQIDESTVYDPDSIQPSSTLEKRLGGMMLTVNDGISSQGSVPMRNSQSTSTEVSSVIPVNETPKETEKDILEVQEGMALSPEHTPEPCPPSNVTRLSEEQELASSHKAPISLMSPSYDKPSEIPVNISDMKDKNVGFSVVTRQVPIASTVEQDPSTHSENQVSPISTSIQTEVPPAGSLPPVIPGAEYVSPATFTVPHLAKPVQPVDHVVHADPIPVELPPKLPSISAKDNSVERIDSSQHLQNENNDFSTQQELLNQLLQSNTDAPSARAGSDEMVKPAVPEKDEFVQQDDPEASEMARREAIRRRLARMGGQRIAGLGQAPIQETIISSFEPSEDFHEASVYDGMSSSKTQETTNENQDPRSPTSPPVRMPPAIPIPVAEPKTGFQEDETIVTDGEAQIKTNKPTRPPPRAPPRAPPPVPE